MNSRTSLVFAATVTVSLVAVATAQETPSNDSNASNASTPASSTPPASTTTESSRPLSTVQIDTQKLASLGQETFLIASRASSSNGADMTFDSEVTMRTSVGEGKVHLHDTWNIMGRTYQVNLTCQPDAILSVESCSMSMTSGDKTTTGEISIGADSANGQVGGREVAFAYPAGTVNLAAMFRIVTQLPDTPGLSYTFPSYSEAIQLRAQTPGSDQPFSVTCQGPASIETESGPIQATRFTVNVTKPMDLFVDSQSRLQKMVADQGQTVMIRQPGTATAAVETDASE